MSDAALGADLLRRAGISECCGGPDRGLLALLREDAPIYAGRGAVEADRLRAFVMECVGRAGLAGEAVAFIDEDLRTASDPYLLAASARAICRLAAVPGGMEALLRAAGARIAGGDEIVCLDAYPAPLSGGRSACEEIEAAIGWVAGRACRDAQTGAAGAAAGLSLAALDDVALQDQDGEETSFRRLFRGRACAIAFFYTRCMNPEKCSRTIGRLGALAGLLGGSEAVVAGITYDPAYDVPRRLRLYGEARGFPFGERACLLRTVGAFEPVRAALGLCVGYGAATVNRHAVEMFVADADGRVTAAWARQPCDEMEVAEALLRIA